MAKRRPDLVKEKKEWIIYLLFYFFVASLLIKVVLGIISGSRCLLVSGILALFGVFITVVTMMRIGQSHPARRIRTYFNRGKLELVMIAGASVIIVLCTGALLFFIAHMIFFHTLYPPDLFAAWIGAVIASIDLCLMVWIKKEMVSLREADERDISFILNADFIISLVIMASVVISRNGFQIADYACAIFAALFFIAYSASFLRTAFAALMDASCDKETVSVIEGLIKKTIPPDALSSLRVNKAGQLFEIIVMIRVAGEMSMREARGVAAEIKDKVRSEFLMSHEVFVGIESR